MLRAIVFDFDGVIADSEPLHCRAFQRVAARFDFSFTYDQYLQRYVGFDDRDAFRALLADAHQPTPSPDELARLVREKGDAFEAVVSEGITTFPGVVEFIRHAGDELPIAIASGATQRDIDLILGRLGLDGLFNPIVTADMVRRSKPDPETYLLAVERLAGLHPQRRITAAGCLAIEDTPAGIASARGAGLWTLGLATTSTSASVAAAHRVAPNLAGLSVATLQTWFG